MLNSEFFEDLRKKDELEVIAYFGHKLGRLLYKHALLEDKFNTVCVEDGVKMTPLESEFITEEARQCALDIRTTTAKLIREFSIEENQKKLKLYESREIKSAEFTAFVDSW
jgi:hypothetical protein